MARKIVQLVVGQQVGAGLPSEVLALDDGGKLWRGVLRDTHYQWSALGGLPESDPAKPAHEEWAGVATEATGLKPLSDDDDAESA